MVGYVTSLDNPKKKMTIDFAEKSAIGDLVLHANEHDFFASAHIVGPGGHGPKNRIQSIYAAAVAVNNLFVHNKQDALKVKEIAIDPVNFLFEEENVITFAEPDFVSMMLNPKMDFIKSKTGFFAIRTRNSKSVKTGRMNKFDPIWLCGPDDKELAKAFGKTAYNTRLKLFGKFWDMASNDQMVNPLFSMPNGSDYITKGKQNALNQ